MAKKKDTKKVIKKGKSALKGSKLVKKVAKPAKKVSNAKPAPVKKAQKSTPKKVEKVKKPIKKEVPQKPEPKTNKKNVIAPAKPVSKKPEPKPLKNIPTKHTPPPPIPAKPKPTPPKPEPKKVSAPVYLIKTKKRRYELEYMLKTLPGILYPRLSNPSGLAEWFADEVEVKGDLHTFDWSGHKEQAKLLAKKQDEYIRFQWIEDKDTECFFEFRIKIDPMTAELILVITDYCEERDMKEAATLWNHQIAELKHNLGLV